jgi:hypothetical protein
MSVPKQPCVRHNSLPSEEPCGWWRLCPDRLKNQAGVDSAWQQENLEARVSTPPVDNQKLLDAKRGDESHLRSAMAGTILGVMECRGRVWGRSARVSRLRPWDVHGKIRISPSCYLTARRGAAAPWGSLREREEPASVGATFDPKIHASMQ